MRKNNDFNSSDLMDVRVGINEKIIDSEPYNGHKHENTLKQATLSDSQEDYEKYTEGRKAKSIVAKDKSKTIKPGESYLVGLVFDPNCNRPEITWVSSNTNVAKVDYTGNVVGISKGSSTITAYCQYYGSYEAIEVTINITVA